MVIVWGVVVFWWGNTSFSVTALCWGVWGPWSLSRPPGQSSGMGVGWWVENLTGEDIKWALAFSFKSSYVAFRSRFKVSFLVGLFYFHTTAQPQQSVRDWTAFATALLKCKEIPSSTWGETFFNIETVSLLSFWTLRTRCTDIQSPEEPHWFRGLVNLGLISSIYMSRFSLKFFRFLDKNVYLIDLHSPFPACEVWHLPLSLSSFLLSHHGPG